MGAGVHGARLRNEPDRRHARQSPTGRALVPGERETFVGRPPRATEPRGAQPYDARPNQPRTPQPKTENPPLDGRPAPARTARPRRTSAVDAPPVEPGYDRATGPYVEEVRTPRPRRRRADDDTVAGPGTATRPRQPAPRPEVRP